MHIQGKTSLVAKTLVALLAPTALYWQDLIMVANEALNNDLATHILAIPFILIYIVYRIRRTIIASVSNHLKSPTVSGHLPFKEIIGTLLCLLAYLIKWFGSYTFQPLEYHVASLPLFVAGITLIIFNTQTLRTLFFPIAFLAFLIPPPVQLAQSAGYTLATLSAQVAYILLKTTGLPVRLYETYGSPIIYLKTSSGTEIPLAIDIACSGLYSLIGFIIFGVFIAYTVREPLKKKLAILSLGLPLIYSLNILRIIVIVLIGYYSGPTFALNIFHLLGGWTLILMGTIILFLIAEKAFKIQIFGSTIETCAHSNRNEDNSFCIDCGRILKTTQNNISITDATKIILILTITISLLFVQVPVFALTEGPAEVSIQKLTGEQITTKILPNIEGYEVNFFYRDVEFEKVAGQDAALTFQYVPETRTKRIIWVGIEIGPTKGCLHKWEVCLITWPQTHGREVSVTQLDLSDVHLLDNPPLTARYFAFRQMDTDNTQVILYWYIQSIFKTEEGYQRKWTKISVIEYTNNPQEYKNIKAELLPIAMAIANYWQPIKNWSWIALAIAENGFTFIIITCIMLIGTLFYNIYIEINRRKNVKNTYDYISNLEDRKIVDIIKGLKKQLATNPIILSRLNESSKIDVDIVTFEMKLSEAEEAGLIQKELTKINDKPYIVWKTKF